MFLSSANAAVSKHCAETAGSGPHVQVSHRSNSHYFYSYEMDSYEMDSTYDALCMNEGDGAFGDNNLFFMIYMFLKIILIIDELTCTCISN